ncbi:uncharacterized protein LOC142536722 isoform X2 [Primulina tabacum]|uniref:uncharacterized protein LOC142536722 isoform X2 n=1 Tax=Primulina tabacum TaxID=48773 RepID=UPI003F593F44
MASRDKELQLMNSICVVFFKRMMFSVLKFVASSMTAAYTYKPKAKSMESMRSNRPKGPDNKHMHKVQEEIATPVAVGAGGYTFHEHHQKKEAKHDQEKAEGKHHHHHH